MVEGNRALLTGPDKFKYAYISYDNKAAWALDDSSLIQQYLKQGFDSEVRTDSLMQQSKLCEDKSIDNGREAAIAG